MKLVQLLCKHGSGPVDSTPLSLLAHAVLVGVQLSHICDWIYCVLLLFKVAIHFNSLCRRQLDLKAIFESLHLCICARMKQIWRGQSIIHNYNLSGNFERRRLFPWLLFIIDDIYYSISPEPMNFTVLILVYCFLKVNIFFFIKGSFVITVLLGLEEGLHHLLFDNYRLQEAEVWCLIVLLSIIL